MSYSFAEFVFLYVSVVGIESLYLVITTYYGIR